MKDAGERPYPLIANINPIRYRGYYYDSETGLYYVSSRYYDPEVGRFISPDTTDVLTATPDQLTDKNLYAYCDNNPVMRVDKDGRFWNFIIGAVGGALIGGGVQIISNLVSGKNWSDGLGVAMATGVASGLLAASGVGLIGSIAGNAAISMAGNATNQVVKNNGFNNFDVGDMVIDGVIGGVAGAAGGSGMEKSANISTLNRNLTKKVFSGSTQVARQVENPNNKVLIKTGLHRRIHTNAYYGWANSIVISAYDSANGNKAQQVANVYLALSIIRTFVQTLNEYSPY